MTAPRRSMKLARPVSSSADPTSTRAALATTLLRCHGVDPAGAPHYGVSAALPLSRCAELQLFSES